MLDSRTYTVEFSGGAKLKYVANIIEESMWAQLDLDGNQYDLLLDSIMDQKKNNDAVEKANHYVVTNI
jgi:hypothetical protein